MTIPSIELAMVLESSFAFSIFVLAGSMAVLAYVSSFVIRSIEDFMELTGLGETAVGFALLSVITSTPELVVAAFSLAEGAPGLTVGDLLGSNVFNLGVVVGLLMLISGFLKECPEGLVEIADILLLSSIIPLLLVSVKGNNWLIGVGLLTLFVYTVYRETRLKGRVSQPVLTENQEGSKSSKSRSLTFVKILIGTLVIVVSARFTVSSALEIAGFLGIPVILIGAKLVAIGTSLPELSLSIAAVRRGRIYLATANAIGSNLTNLTLILGIVLCSSFFNPFILDLTAFTEVISFVLITSLIIWYYITKGGNCRRFGAILILTYVFFQAVSVVG